MKTGPVREVIYCTRKKKRHLILVFGSAHYNFPFFTLPALQVEDLDIVRPLTLSERAVAVALAVSLDNDFFSRHSNHSW